MDDFSLERPELTGSLISMEFGSGGRIQQIWASDPNQPEQGEEFQFVLPPLAFGEEFAEDYYPGTILIGARTSPEDPWILSRNTEAAPIEGDENPSIIEFQYEFALLPEISATGRFYEQPGTVPAIVWDIELTNNGKLSLELGELAFPFALNNLYDGFPRTDVGARDLLNERVYIHKFIGGAASYIFAQRMTAEPPGLLIVPGEDTSFEFYNHVPASLTTPYRWEGIPVVYVHSKAALERESWAEWFNEHTSQIFEAGETKRYQIRFLPGDRDRSDNVHLSLQMSDRPCMRLIPGAVAPAHVGIAVEVAGATPTQFTTDVEAELETDADEEGGFCFVKPAKPGAVRLTFVDTKDRVSHGHLLFTEPIEDLIKRRAAWIVANQVFKDEGNFKNAILVTDVQADHQLADPEEYGSGFGITGSMADALFLAEKNTIYPVKAEIKILDAYIKDFLRDDIQNPADGSVGSSFGDHRAVAFNQARPALYGLAANLYHAMARIAAGYGETEWDAARYLREAGKTIEALYRGGFPRGIKWAGVPGMHGLQTLPYELKAEDEDEAALNAARSMGERAAELIRRRVPFATDSLWSTQGFEEAFYASRVLRNDEAEELIFRCAYAARSHAPSWWWYGSDKRFLDDQDSPHPAMLDKGEMCLGPTTSANSLLFFDAMDRDYTGLPESSMRLAFGGLLGVWALVRADGAAAMGFCPDSASRQYGMSWLTGDVGLTLWHYLRNVAATVLPSRNAGVATFGCHFEIETDKDDEFFVVRPWDGVGRRIVIRQIGLEVETSGLKIEEFRFDSRKRYAVLKVLNTSDKEHEASVRIKGLWGDRFKVDGRPMQAVDGDLAIGLNVSPGVVTALEIKVDE